MKEQTITKWSERTRILWLYTKYQLISKIIVGSILLPFFSFITELLIKSSGRTNISSGDYFGFFMSLNGLPVIILGILMLVLILGIDINTFIIISSLVEENRLEMKIKDVLLSAIKSLKYFFSPVGIFLVFFIAVVLPILGFTITLSPLKNFHIPNFVTSVIFNNPIYYFSYIIVLVLLIIISIIYIFTIHFMLIDNQPVFTALKSSRLLIKNHWKRFIIDYFWNLIKLLLTCLAISIIVLGALILLSIAANLFYVYTNIIAILLLISALELFSFFGFVSVPIIISLLTKMFYKYNKQDGKKIKLKFENKFSALPEKKIYKKTKLKTRVELLILLLIMFIFNFAIAFLLEQDFSELIKINPDLQLIAHRGGGDLGAENTVASIKNAIKENVNWTEIDVQRTKDGQYIINHDATFARLTGVNKTPMDMTLKEIKQLKVKNEFYVDSEVYEIPTLEEVLDVAKGKIGVFVELKGKSADTKMVDEVIQLIKQKDMLDECVILSLNYSIIEYTEKMYPEIKTGFLYFFSVGKLKNLKGDYLIMEEREATPEKIDEIHAAEKKAIVWTVNTPKSIKKFIYSDVDGIITDHIGLIKDIIQESGKRSSIEIVIENFFL